MVNERGSPSRRGEGNSEDNGNGTARSTNDTATDTAQSWEKHIQFCCKVGIVHYEKQQKKWLRRVVPSNSKSTPRSDEATDLLQNEPQSLEYGRLKTATPLEPVKGGIYETVYTAYWRHTMQYWLVATTINGLYLAQIAIGATATALGSVGVANTGTAAQTVHTKAITILTAVVTVIAGLLTYFKSRGQPNRVRQLRNDLRKVCDYIQFMEMEFSPPACEDTSVEDAVKEVKRLYDLARDNAETNYPDTWSVTPSPREAQISLPVGTRVVGKISPGGKVSNLEAKFASS